MVFLMRGGDPYGECDTLRKLPDVDVASFVFRRFTDPANIKPEEIEQAKLAFSTVRGAVLSGNYDIVVLDEVNVDVAWRVSEVDEVVGFIKEKPANVELILTGRQADAKLVELADLVTECLKIKHPYDKGIWARKGIDY